MLARRSSDSCTWLRTAPSRSTDCFGPGTSLGNNLLGDLTGCSMTLQSSDLTGHPGLGEFIDDGTPGHGHFPLLAASRAINAGNDAACPPADQLGQPRVDRCDIGAIEFPGAVVLVNDLVGFAPRRATFRFILDPTGCPAGVVGTFRFASSDKAGAGALRVGQWRTGE
jgi:hypothetical protein